MTVARTLLAALAGTVVIGAALAVAVVHYAVAGMDAVATQVIEPAGRLLFMVVDGMSYHAVAGHPKVSVTDAWSRATPSVSVGVLYATITAGDAPDRLVAVSTQRAARCELHESFMQGTVSSMHSVDAVPVEPGAQVVLKPGGYHVMLLGLTSPLAKDEAFPVTLKFERAGDITIQARVAAAGAASMPAMTGMDHGKK